MIYLLIQTWIWMLLATSLGLFIGWLIWRREGSSDCSEVQRLLDECKRKCNALEDQQSKAVEEPEKSDEVLSAASNNSEPDVSADDSSDKEESDQPNVGEESKPTS